MSREWDDLADWWLTELESDPTYEQVVVPLLLQLVAADRGTVLDVGCGNGRIMTMLKGGELNPIGCDLNAPLLEDARLSRASDASRPSGYPFARWVD